MNNKDPASNNNPGPNNTANHEYLNPINILGIPSRSNHDTRHAPPPTTQEQNHKMNFKIFKSSSRCGMGSLLNLHKIPSKTSLQRSNSARECGMLGPVLGGGHSGGHVNTNISSHTIHINAGTNHRNGVAADFNNYTDRLQVSCG